MGLNNKTIVKTFRDWKNGGAPLSLEEAVKIAEEEKSVKGLFIRLHGCTESEADRILHSNNEYAVLAAAKKNSDDIETMKRSLKAAKDKNEKLEEKIEALETEKKNLERQIAQNASAPAPAPAPVTANPAPTPATSEDQLSLLRSELSTVRGKLTKAETKVSGLEGKLAEANGRIIQLERQLEGNTADEEALRKAIRDAAELRIQLQTAEALKEVAEGQVKELVEKLSTANTVAGTTASQTATPADATKSSAFSTVQLPTGQSVNVVVATANSPITVEDREALAALKEKGVVTGIAPIFRKPYAMVDGQPVVVDSINPDVIMKVIQKVDI